jgi:hypothetical protein
MCLSRTRIFLNAASLFFSLALLMAANGLLLCLILSPGSLADEIDAAEERWQAQGITDYRIAVRSASVWHNQTDIITVRDGDVTEHSASCTNSLLEREGECEIEPADPQTRTVEGLFAGARDLVNLAAGGESVVYVLEGLSFEFHSVYGYPELIASSPPNVYDAAWGWMVEEFEDLS